MDSEFQDTLLCIQENHDELIGIRIIKSGDEYMIGISWKTKNGSKYRNFYSSAPSFINKSLMGLLEQQKTIWQHNLKEWYLDPKKHLLLGKIR